MALTFDAPGRREALEGHGRFYGAHRFAVTFTAKGETKRVVKKAWENTTLLPDSEYAAALLGNRGLSRNVAIVLRPSSLVGIETDGAEDLDRMRALELPDGLLERSSTADRIHAYYQPPPDLDGGLGYVAFKFEAGRVTAARNAYSAAPSLHASGTVYEILAGGLDLTEIPALSLAQYLELLALAGEKHDERGGKSSRGQSARISCTGTPWSASPGRGSASLSERPSRETSLSGSSASSR